MSKTDFRKYHLSPHKERLYKHFESHAIFLDDELGFKGPHINAYNAQRSEEYDYYSGKHQEIVVGLVIGGTGSVSTVRGQREVFPGMLYLSMPSRKYLIKNNQANPLHTLSLHCHHWPWLENRINEVFDIVPTVIYPKFFHELEMVFWGIIRGSKDEPEFAARVLPHFFEIIFEHMQNASLSRQKGQSIAWRSFERCIRYLSENYVELASVQDLADACDINPGYMCRLFKSYSNQSPLFILQKYKIKHACQSLIFTNRSVKEIAFEIGYTDSATFSKAFKRKMGVSPIDYRKRGGGV